MCKKQISFPGPKPELEIELCRGCLGCCSHKNWRKDKSCSFHGKGGMKQPVTMPEEKEEVGGKSDENQGRDPKKPRWRGNPENMVGQWIQIL